MAAVLQTVLDDCRGRSTHQRTMHLVAPHGPDLRRARAYVASTDRTWPFSFENLCEALGVDADALRDQLEPRVTP